MAPIGESWLGFKALSQADAATGEESVLPVPRVS